MRVASPLTLALALLAALAGGAGADDWPAPRPVNVFNEDGSRFVRITPGGNFGASVGFAGAEKGPNARAEFYRRQPDASYTRVADIRLLNPVAPVEALVNRDGRLITLDNWHNAGYGAVVAIYAPDGKVVASWALDHLYEAKDLERITHSVSSRWWRCPAFGFSDPAEQTRVYVSEQLGGNFVFDLATGGQSYHPGKATCPE